MYRATQASPVRRELAIKLLKPGMDSEAVLRRFDAERQALARLNHPAVARIHDAGTTPGGRPYFAMELVDGVPITAECDRLKLPVAARLELFRAVCLGVQHAHQKGVVHRDLKPSNVLVTTVDGKPQPKIIDFGIAKALDEPLTSDGAITLARQVIGTPRYMSPEQAEVGNADVDSRSDVYSLGVLLYELLTGTTPLTDADLPGSDWTGLAERLRHTVFPPPSSRLRGAARARAEQIAERRGTTAERLRRAISGDLDCIALRALEPDPSRRYPTAFALARDVERSLAHETIDARPPDRLYRAQKFVRRNRVSVGVACVIALSVLAVAGTEFRTLRRVQAEGRATRAALAEAQAVTDFLAQTFTSIDAEGAGAELRLADVLRQASSQLDRGDAFGASVSLAAQARLHGVLGISYWELGDWRSAEHHLRRSASIAEQLGRELTPLQLQTMMNLASLVYERGDPSAALRLMREAEPGFRRVFGPESDRTLGFLGNLALMTGAAGEPERALDIERRVLSARERVDGPDAARTIGAMHNLAVRLDAAGRHDEARELLLEAVARAERALAPESPERVLVVGELGSLELVRDPASAKHLLRQTLASREATLGPEHPRSLHTAYNLALAHYRLGEHAEAAGLLARVLACVPGRLPHEHPVSLGAMNMLGVVGMHAGWALLGEATAERLVATVRDAPLHALAPSHRNDLALVLCTVEPARLRDMDLAELLLVALVSDAEAHADPDLYFFLDSLGQLRHAQARYAEAITAYQRAINLTPPERPDHRREIEAHLALTLAAHRVNPIDANAEPE